MAGFSLDDRRLMKQEEISALKKRWNRDKGCKGEGDVAKWVVIRDSFLRTISLQDGADRHAVENSPSCRTR
jgi:hypothetical protein